MCIVGFGAAALRKRFRVYSIVTIVIVLACGAVTGMYTSRIQADLPTPGVGVWERISIATFMAWIVVLAAALLRAPRTAATPILGAHSRDGPAEALRHALARHTFSRRPS